METPKHFPPSAATMGQCIRGLAIQTIDLLFKLNIRAINISVSGIDMLTSLDISAKLVSISTDQFEFDADFP